MLVDSTDGVAVAVHDLGGAGPNLLFAHATRLHAAIWSPVAAHLVGDFAMTAVDFRGHGDTRTPRGLDFDWNGFADDVLAVVDGLDFDRPVGASHSLGAAALLLAEQRRPGTFESLWCYEPVVFPSTGDAPTQSEDLSEGAARRREFFESRARARANFAAKPPFNQVAPPALDAYVAHGFADDPDGGVRLKCRPADEAQMFRMGPRHHGFDALDRVHCPTTIAYGRTEVVGPALIAELVVDRLADGRGERLAELGHFGPLEDPARIAASIGSALAR